MSLQLYKKYNLDEEDKGKITYLRKSSTDSEIIEAIDKLLNITSCSVKEILRILAMDGKLMLVN